MVITCQQCSARLQLDDAKVPSRPFTVRCPKCQHIINAQPPAQEPDYSAFGSGEVIFGFAINDHNEIFAAERNQHKIVKFVLSK